MAAAAAPRQALLGPCGTPNETATAAAVAEPVMGEESCALSATETATALEIFRPASRVAVRASSAPVFATRSAAESSAIATVALTKIDALAADAKHGHALGEAEAEAPALQLLVAEGEAVLVAVAVFVVVTEGERESVGVTVLD